MSRVQPFERSSQPRHFLQLGHASTLSADAWRGELSVAAEGLLNQPDHGLQRSGSDAVAAPSASLVTAAMSPWQVWVRRCRSRCPPGRSGTQIDRRLEARRDLVVRESGSLVGRPFGAAGVWRRRAGAGQRVGRSERGVLAARESGVAPRTGAFTSAVPEAIWSGQPIPPPARSPISSPALQTSAIVSTGSGRPMKPGTGR